MSNIYKPRYKISFKSLTKTWPYKNSRLRKFVDRRGNFPFRKGYWHRQYIMFKNLKWNLIRRVMRPKMRKRIRKKGKYKHELLNIKKLQKFYGKFDAYNFQKIFYLFYSKTRLNKLDSFIFNLEQRLDVVIFRLKFLPTIVACHNFIAYKGLLVNNNKIMYPYTRINIGDIVSFQKNIWFYFWYIFERKIYTRLIRTFSFYNRWKVLFYKLKIEFKTARTWKKWRTFKRKWFFKAKKKNKIKWRLRFLRQIQKYKQKVLNAQQKNKIFKNSKQKQMWLLLINRKLQYNHNTRIERQNFKNKINQIKLLNTLKILSEKLNLFKNVIQIVQQPALSWFFFQLVLKYKQLKFFFFSKIFLIKKNKFQFLKNIIKKKLVFFIYNILIKCGAPKSPFIILTQQIIEQIFLKILKNKLFLIGLFGQIKNLFQKKNDFTNIQKIIKKRPQLINIPINLKVTTPTNFFLTKMLFWKIKYYLLSYFFFKKNTKIFLNDALEKKNLIISKLMQIYNRNYKIGSTAKKKTVKMQFFSKLATVFNNRQKMHFLTRNANIANIFLLKKHHFNTKKQMNGFSNIFNKLWNPILMEKILIQKDAPHFVKKNKKKIIKYKNFQNIIFFLGNTMKMRVSRLNKNLFRFLQSKYNVKHKKKLIKYHVKNFYINILKIKKKIALPILYKISQPLYIPFQKKNIISTQINVQANFQKNNFIQLKKHLFLFKILLQYFGTFFFYEYKKKISLEILNKWFVSKNAKEYSTTQLKKIFDKDKNALLLKKELDFIFKWYKSNQKNIISQQSCLQQLTDLLLKNFLQKSYYIYQTLILGKILFNKIFYWFELKRFSQRYFIKKYFYLFFYKTKKKSIFPENKVFTKKIRRTKIQKILLKKTWWRRYKKRTKGWVPKPIWYIPNYLEFDFKTLRGGIIRKIFSNEINYPFAFSLKDIICFYKDRGF